jgi:hypothetical protein
MSFANGAYSISNLKVSQTNLSIAQNLEKKALFLSYTPKTGGKSDSRLFLVELEWAFGPSWSGTCVLFLCKRYI